MRAVLRLIVLLLFSLSLSSALASACASPILDEWIYPGDAFEFDNTAARLDLSSNDNVRIRFDDGEFYILSLGDSLSYQFYEILYVDIDKDICTHDKCSVKAYGKIDPETGETIPGARLQVCQNSPTIKATKTTPDAEVLLDQEVEITVVIENTGQGNAQQVRYRETFPQGMIPLTTTKGTISSNGLEVRLGTLEPNQDEEFTFRVMLIDEVDTALSGFITYFAADKFYEIQSENLDIKVKKVLDVTLETETTSLYPTNETDIELKFVNNNDETAEAVQVSNIAVTIPSALEVLQVPDGFVKEGNAYLLDEIEVTNNKNRTYNFTVRADSAASYSLFATYDAFFQKKLPSDDVQLTLAYSDVGEQDYTLEFVPAGRQYLEGTQATLQAALFNPDKLYSLQDVSITYNFTLNNETQKYAYTKTEIEAEKSYITPLLQIDLPQVNYSEKKITVDVNGQAQFFLPKNDVKKTVDFSTTFEILDLLEALSIEKDADDASIDQNESTIVTVTAKNNLNYGGIADVTFKELIPDQFNSKGEIEKEVSFDYEEENVIFTYEITAPFLFNESDNIVQTQVQSDEAIGYANLTIDVDVPVPELTLTRSITDILTLGSIVDDRYSVKNSGDIDVYRVVFNEQGAPGADIALDVTQNIVDVLEPGEEVTYVSKLRLSKPGETVVEGSTVYVSDEYGNRHLFEFNEIDIEIEDAIITEQAISIERSILSINDDTITIEAKLSNHGGATANGEFDDQGNRFDVVVGGGDEKYFEYDLTLLPIENVTFPGAEFVYENRDVTWLAQSPELNITRTIVPEATTTITVNQEVPEENNTVEQPTTTDTPAFAQNQRPAGTSLPDDVVVLTDGAQNSGDYSNMAIAFGIVVGAGILILIIFMLIKQAKRRKSDDFGGLLD